VFLKNCGRPGTVGLEVHCCQHAQVFPARDASDFNLASFVPVPRLAKNPSTNQALENCTPDTAGARINFTRNL
jgi:hypothetical protein